MYVMSLSALSLDRRATVQNGLVKGCGGQLWPQYVFNLCLTSKLSILHFAGYMICICATFVAESLTVLCRL